MIKTKEIFLLVITLLIALCIFPSYIFAGGRAIFGLQWGMSPSQIEEAGSRLSFIIKNKNLITYKTYSLPENNEETKEYRLTFEEKTGLVKIVMAGKIITEDDFGDEGKKRFNVLDSYFKNKYKEIKMSENLIVGIDPGNRPDEFYQCLTSTGCGMWAKAFTSENIEIVLELKGLGKGEGYINITAEAVPELGNALIKYNSK